MSNLKAGEYVYETDEEFGPIGECPVSVKFYYTQGDGDQQDWEVEIMEATFYNQGRTVHLLGEEIQNLHSANIEDECMEYAEAQLSKIVGQDPMDAYKQRRDDRLTGDL